MRSWQLNLSTLLLALFSSAAIATERADLTQLDIQYGDRAPLKLYANSKYSIKVLGVPTEAYLAQIMPRLRTDFIELRILGERSIEIDGPSLSFGLQLPQAQKRSQADCDLDPNSVSVCSNDDYVNYGELRIKTFTKVSDSSYLPLEDYVIPVQSTFCLEHKPVCGLLGGAKKTYSDTCELGKAGAELLYEHTCQ